MAKDLNTKALMLFLNQRPMLEELEAADLGRLVLALMEYLDSGKEPDFTGALRLAFVVLRGDVDRSMQRWAEECRRRSEAGKKGAAALKGKKFTEKVSCESDAESEEQPAAALNGAEQSRAELSSAGQSRATPAYTNSNSCTNSYSYSNANTNSDTNSSVPPSCPPKGTERAFEQFWQAYPKKTGKRAAREAFGRANAPLDRLLAAIAQQRSSPQWQRENGRYIPNPAAWLNRNGWEDELPPGDVQRHGAPLSPLAQAAVRRMMAGEI